MRLRQSLSILTLARAVDLLGAMILAGVLASSSVAGPPLVTDDSETPGRHGWEINLSHNIEKTRREFLMESPLIDINYGLLENDQWKIEFPLLSVDPADEEGHWGIGDLLLGWKYRFLEEDDHGFMASIYPQLLVPTGNENLGLSDGNAELFLPAQWGKHFFEDKLFVYAELGHNIVLDDDGTNWWKYGLAFEWQETENTVLLGEIGGFVFEESDEPDHAFFNLGCKHELSDHCTLLLSAGRSFHQHRNGAPELLTFIGFQFTWGGEANDKADDKETEKEDDEDKGKKD